MESNSNVKGNLYYLEKSYYLSKSDPLFWKKLFQRQTDNVEAMYHVGLAYEIEAKKYLQKFYSSRVNQHLILYQNAIRQSFELLQRSLIKGYIPARLEILRMEREMKLIEKELTQMTKPSEFNKKQILFLFIVGIVVSFLGTFFCQLIKNRL